MNGLWTYFAAMARALAFWRREPPLSDIDGLSAYCLARASYVAQTALYGYLRTRAGLQHFNLFTDKKFTKLLKPARSRLVLVCLDDLAVYASALLPEIDDRRRATVATHIFARAITALEEQADKEEVLSAQELTAAQHAFEAHCTSVDWAVRAAPDMAMAAFRKSADALIELAPIVDDLKRYDDTIVTNSMHFKWLSVRAELRRRLDTDALLASLT